jgi:nicotinate-nucleotide adenylyltransferase
MGHLIMASEAVERLRLAEILFVPARRPAHKRARGLAPIEDRVAMLRIATRREPRFRVSRIEADGEQVNFTARTLGTLADRERADYFFLMGQDSLEEFTTWREPERILALARLAVVPRGEGELPLLPSAVRRRIIFIRPPRIGISSTEIRRRLRRGLTTRYWVPDAVLAYVSRHGLYGIGRRHR